MKAAIETGDQRELIARWFVEYKTPLIAYLLRLVGDEEQAAELLQDTFVRALTACVPEDLPANPYAWLHCIATRLAYNALRRRNRLRWLPLVGDERAPDFEGRFVAADGVRRCLAQLAPRDAEVLLLYEYGGFSCVEIASLTGEAPNAVRVRVFRARQRFIRLYERER